MNRWVRKTIEGSFGLGLIALAGTMDLLPGHWGDIVAILILLFAIPMAVLSFIGWVRQ